MDRRDEIWRRRFARARALALVAAAGGVTLLASLTLHREQLRDLLGGLGVLLVLPFFVYVYVLIIWHWKDRYRGQHSDLWGGLILLEVTGWMKLVYLLRHLIPDWRRSGRYAPIHQPPA